MPTIFRYKGYRFFFYSNESDPIEPCHIHVRMGSSLAKYWVVPDILLANSYGFNSSGLKELERVVKEHKE